MFIIKILRMKLSLPGRGIIRKKMRKILVKKW